jgi:hypothetical protein
MLRTQHPWRKSKPLFLFAANTGRCIMNQAQEPCAYGATWLLNGRSRFGSWRSHTIGYAQRLDVSYLVQMRGSVDRRMLDLR